MVIHPLVIHPVTMVIVAMEDMVVAITATDVIMDIVAMATEDTMADMAGTNVTSTLSTLYYRSQF